AGEGQVWRGGGWWCWEELWGDRGCAAVPSRARRCLVRVRLQPRDQFHQVSCRHDFLGDDHHRIAREERDGFEILQEVVLKLVDRAVQDVSAPDADDKRISITSRASDPADTDTTGRASHVFKNDGLTE